MTWRESWIHPKPGEAYLDSSQIGLRSSSGTPPIIGEKAALARYRITVTMICFGLSMLLLVAVGLIAASVRNSAIETVAYLMLVPPFVFIVGRFWLRHTYFRYASEAIGVPIRTRNDVPVSREGYERWCVKNGVTPYSIKPRPE
ncbi:MAG: hypothetical protein ABSH29_15160 [Acidimicrobiales bacterium]